ncbi:hypothetical protein CF319_g8838, partial [Tilletia indica]
MKNYIANESGNWDTSSALVRRTLTKCIEMGRRARQSGRAEDLYEAYRLLGQALHTLQFSLSLSLARARSMHSLLGEAQDHLSEASVSDLSKAVEGARSQQGGSREIGGGGGGNALGNLMGLLNKVPGGPDGSV